MLDSDIKDICSSIIRGYERCDAIRSASSDRPTTDAEMLEIFELSSRGRREIAAVALMPSSTLSGCRAKASVLSIMPNDDLAASIASDILIIVEDDRSALRSIEVADHG